MRLAARYTLAPVAALLALGAADLHAQAVVGSFERSLTVSQPLELDVATGSGSITITNGAAGRAEVVGRIRARSGWRRSSPETEEIVRALEADPPIELSGNRLRIGHIDVPEYRDNVSISYEIRVPAETSVRSRTGSGAQTIEGVVGPVETSAGSGSITLADIRAGAEAHTGSGSIRADRVDGEFRARTGSGSVRLTHAGQGDVTVATGSGRAELSGVVGALRARTGSGSITVDGTQTGSWDLETGSGSIQVRLPADAAFELAAHTGSGDVYTTHPITLQGRVDRRRVSGAVRGGGELLSMRTGSGSIRIE